MTDVTRDWIIHVTRARVTAISRFPVTCVTSLWKRGFRTPQLRHAARNAAGKALRHRIIPSHSQERNALRCPLLPMRFLRVGSVSQHLCKPLDPQLILDCRPICPNHVASGEAAELADMPGLSHKIRPGGGGWGEKPAPCWISTSRPNFAAAAKKSGGRLSENLVEHC